MGQNSTADIASSDIIHTRIALKVDPGKRFLAGSTTHIVAIADSCKWLPIELQLSDDYIINSITSGPHQLPYYRQSGKLRIYPHPLWGKTDSITINYCGIPPSTGLGSVVFDRHDTVPVFWTMSEPYGAMDWFPCKQDINDKIDSTFIIITCPKRYTAVSNGVLHSDTETESGNMRRMEWRHHYPIAYYLIAVAVSNYRKYSDWGKGAGNDSVEIVNYVYPERYEQWRRKTYKLIPAMRMLCDSFGPYPFRNEKYAQAQFGWSGGMENQTVSFINNANLDLMIHELAHQWFGNMITCSSWHDIFLSEGFATYCEMLAAEKEIVESQDPQQWRTAMINMACSNPHGTVYVANDKSHHEIFNYSTTYAKGAMVVHTLRKELGDQVFFRCIKSYISNPLNKYKNTSIKDLFRAIRIISGRNLDWFTQQWIYGSGYPQYHIIWQQNYDGLIDMQINQTVSDTSVSFFRGKIPLMLHGYNGEKTYYVFNNNSPRQHITINPKINVKYIEFDPYKDVLQIGSTVEQAKFANNAVSIKKEPSGNLKVSFPEDYSFDWYIIRSANNSSIKFRQPIGGMHRFEISTSELPEGQYILIMEGSEYYSTTINVSKKRSKNGHGS